MEYTVVTVVVVLVGLIVTVSTPIIKLNTTITKLNASVDNFAKRIDRIEADNNTSHQRIWAKDAEQDKTLGDHENRIVVLEHVTK